MLLAIETSTRPGSVAVGSPGEAPIERRLEDGALASVVAELLPDPSRLSRYAIGVGPGSFTGLRIGVAFLKGLAVVLPRPAFAVSSLELLALGAASLAPTILAVLDARRGEVYAGLYRVEGQSVRLDPALPDGLYLATEVVARAPRDALVVGDGAGLDPFATAWRADPELWIPRAGVLAEHAWTLEGGVDAMGLEPAYHQLAAAEARLLGPRHP